jgi:hypothetical protein
MLFFPGHRRHPAGTDQKRITQESALAKIQAAGQPGDDHHDQGNLDRDNRTG